MNIFDILGPIMVGPSSSHTAGAVRIGYVARKLLGEPVNSAAIYLHGSFLKTAQGHGTDRALVAGLLGMKPDDMGIPDSFAYAKNEGLSFEFHPIVLRDVHPNSCKLVLTGKDTKELTVVASSVGGGIIQIRSIDGLECNFSGDYATLIVHNDDQPGHVTEVSSVLANNHVNIGSMQLYRDSRGGQAIMIIECDQDIPRDAMDKISHFPGIHKITYLSLQDD